MSKFIGVKMIEAAPMRASMALSKGHKIGNAHPDDMGYEVTHPDGYKSWSPKNAFESAYFPLFDTNGNMIHSDDVERFIVKGDSYKLKDKTCVVLDSTITGFDIIGNSACVDPKNYKHGVGVDIARKNIADKVWEYLGFVLQWAKYGLKTSSPVEDGQSKSNIPPHIERIIDEHNELSGRADKLRDFITSNPIFATLSVEEQEDMQAQLKNMTEYDNILVRRLERSGYLVGTIGE